MENIGKSSGKRVENEYLRSFVFFLGRRNVEQLAREISFPC